MCTKPIAQALDRLQGEKGDPNKGCGCYYGVLIPTLIRVHESLEQININSPNMCDKLPAVLLNQFTRFENFLEFSSDHHDAVIAAVSHPYFKLRCVPELNKSEFEDLFKKAVLDLADEESAELPSSSSANPEKNGNDNDDDFSEFKA